MLDLCAICAHPDDLEVCCGGIFIKAAQEGLKTGAILLTRGEAGGHASMQQRIQEAQQGAALLALSFFEQLSFPDAALMCERQTIDAVIPLLRAASPRLIFTLHPDDYHPDHVAASRITDAAAFAAGLKKYSADQTDWHYEALYYFSADPRSNPRRPDILVDISDVMEKKLAACRAHASQRVEEYADAYSRSLGAQAGVAFAEGLYAKRALTIPSISRLLR